MSDLFKDRLSCAMNRQNFGLSLLRERVERIGELIQDELRKTLDELESEAKRSNEEINEVITWKDDPVVYARNYSYTNLFVYHGSLDCGWVNPRRTRKMLLGEARAAGLRPCCSCGYRAAGRADAA